MEAWLWDEEAVVEVAGVGESDCLVESRKESGKSVSGDPDRQKLSQRNVGSKYSKLILLEWLADPKSFVTRCFFLPKIAIS